MTTAIVPTISGWSGLFDAPLARPGSGANTGFQFPPASQNGARNPRDTDIAKDFKRNGYRGINALFLALLGAGVGGTATKTHKQVGAPTTGGAAPFGGNRNIETVTDVDRVTTSADIDWLSKFFNDKLLSAGITYPTYSGPIGGGQGGQLVNGVPRF